MLTISDSISLKILNENTLIAGVGNEIHVNSDESNYALPYKLKGKVHGIECEDSSNKILIYGEYEFILIERSQDSFQLLYSGCLSDWISSGKLLKEADCLMLVTSHSVAFFLKYDKSTQTCEILEKSSCTDKSTLYCSHIYGHTWEESLILGGNAFGEILVWQQSVKSTDNSDKAKLLHRVHGHNGVIFSIDIDIKSKLMVTTSDDRSIRFWDISTVEFDNGNFDFERFRFTPRKSGYSHVARVFKGKIIHEGSKTYAISGGEDSYICLWNQNCELLFKRRQQFGATIWSLDYHSPTSTVFTAGSSGNILKYNLQCFFKDRKPSVHVLGSQSLCCSEYITKIKFLNKTNFIGITNRNRLMHKNGVHDENWIVIESFVSYKSTVLQVYQGYIAVAGYQQVTLLRFLEDTLSFEQIYHGVVLPGVIRSFIFLSHSEYLISDESGNCKLVRTRNFNDSVSIDLPQCKERWVTAACKVDEVFLVASNRQGSLLLYSVSADRSSFKQCDSIKRVHGHLGATTITLIKNVEFHCFLKSSGHDSSIKTIKLNKEEQKLSIMSKEVIPIAWVEKRVMCQDNTNELLFGFNDNHFVLWSREEDKHFEIPCGGGHRCWDLYLDFAKNQVSIVFIKNKQVHLHQEAAFNKFSMSLDIPRNKWHVKPCNVLSCFKGQQKLYIVSGGDDNLLKISQYHSESGSLTQLHEIHSHISSIRGLRVWNAGSLNHLIFSSGGRAQICVTLFNEESHMFEELSDYTIEKEKPSNGIRIDPETRVMSIDAQQVSKNSFEIFAACSDGYLRKFMMQNMSDFSLVTETFYGRCILHVRITKDYLLTVATDGVVCFWKFDISDVAFRIAHHESGVNSFDVRLVNENEFHLLTGGDDQQVVYSKVVHSLSVFDVEILKRMNYLHTAQVTAVSFSPCLAYFYSSSVDQLVQKVNLKSFSSNWETLSCVADVKGIDVIKETDSSNLTAFLYGCGLQVLNL